MSNSDDQLEMFEKETARSLLDQLLRNRAYNAMMLHVQKPCMRYAKSAYDWKTVFECGFRSTHDLPSRVNSPMHDSGMRSS